LYHSPTSTTAAKPLNGFMVIAWQQQSE